MSSGRLKMPILLRGCIGIGHSAATHHSGNYYPHVRATSPACASSCRRRRTTPRDCCKHALRCDDPVMFLEHRELLALKGPVPEEAYEIAFGKAAVVREGRDVTVVALALMVQQTLKACERLATEGDLGRGDRSAHRLAAGYRKRSCSRWRKTGRLLIVDEAFAPFGIGAEIAAQIVDRGFDDLDAPIRRLQRRVHTPTPYSPPLEKAVVPSVEAIAKAVRDLLDE